MKTRITFPKLMKRWDVSADRLIEIAQDMGLSVFRPGKETRLTRVELNQLNETPIEVYPDRIEVNTENAEIGLDVFLAHHYVLLSDVRDAERRDAFKQHQRASSGGTTVGVKVGTGKTITIPHITKTLRALFKVMADHWSKVEARAQPKSVNVAADLDRALGWKPQRDGTPSRSAQTLAAAIRPDDVVDADPRNRKRRRVISPDGTSRR